MRRNSIRAVLKAWRDNQVSWRVALARLCDLGIDVERAAQLLARV